MAAIFSLYPYNPILYVPTATPSSHSHGSAYSFRRQSNFAVLSAHSNPKILKTNRKSVYGRVFSPYDTDEDEEEMDDEDEEEDDDDDDDGFSDVSFAITLPIMN